MGFIIKKIVVHRKPTPVREGEVHYNMDRASWDVRNLLEVFSREFTHKVRIRKNVGGESNFPRLTLSHVFNEAIRIRTTTEIK